MYRIINIKGLFCDGEGVKTDIATNGKKIERIKKIKDTVGPAQLIRNLH